MAADPRTKPVDLGRESDDLLIAYTQHRHLVLLGPKTAYLFYHSTKGRRLSRPRQCSKSSRDKKCSPSHSIL